MEESGRARACLYQVRQVFPGYMQQPREWLAKLELLVVDRPGTLAAISGCVSEHQGNIVFFHYNRAVDASRVALEASFTNEVQALDLLESLEAHCVPQAGLAADEEEVRVMASDRVLEVRVRLANRPGMLAAFARVLASRGANVLYMLYNEWLDAEAATITLATPSPGDVDMLLSVLNEEGYQYRVVYRGADLEEVERVIGLKAVEKFFLKLRGLISEKQTAELMEIVDSSAKLHQSLVDFYAEAGKYLEQGDVFENVLAFATMSVAKAGERFEAEKLPTLEFAGVRLTCWRLPTGANVYAFAAKEEIILFDCGYGIYYDDLKKLLLAEGLAPTRVGRIYLTHADADHAGTSGYFEQEFGTQVYLHPAARLVLETQNRAAGSQSKLLVLNQHFTPLVSAFTGLRPPRSPQEFATSSWTRLAGFPLIDRFRVGCLDFVVLASLGGHVPGQVFFLNREYGLLFTSDYLLNVASLSPEERDYLRLPRYLMTSTNADSSVFQQETAMLKELGRQENRRLESQGRRVRVFPGHGDCYEFNSDRAS